MFTKKYRYYIAVKCTSNENETGMLSLLVTMSKNPTSTELNKILDDIEIPKGYEEYVEDLKLMEELQ